MALYHAPSYPELALDLYVDRIRAEEKFLIKQTRNQTGDTIVISRDDVLYMIGLLTSLDSAFVRTGRKLEELNKLISKMNEMSQ